METGFAASSRAHHGELGRELNHTPGEVIGFGEAIHEAEDFEVSGTVTLYGLVILELEKTNVSVVILNGFLLEAAAFLRTQSEIWILAISAGGGLFRTLSVEVEPGLISHGLLAIRTSQHIHLENPQIYTQLDFLTILALKAARHHLTGLIIPVLQHLSEVERHRSANMETFWTASTHRADELFSLSLPID